jgi:hypothetical protein
MDFPVESSNKELLEKAKNIAEDYAKKQIDDDTVGIVFLGGIARGYFDADADIDIAIFKNENMPEVKITYEIIDGMEVQTFTAGYENEKEAKWEMNKRWAYSNRAIFHDTNKRIEDLLKNKVPLRDEERKWLMISGITLSEWYCVRLPGLWVRRNDLLNAHCMMNEGINQYFNALYALNNELVADFKWRIYCASRLRAKPDNFRAALTDLMTMKNNTEEELERRRNAFAYLWESTLGMIEAEVGMKYAEFKNMV